MIILWILIFIASLFTLIKGSDYFTDSAERIGLFFGIPSFIIGVTIVSFGTSLPELSSSIFAVLKGSGEIVVGNVIGSNIANILLVLGACAVIGKGLKIKFNIFKIDMPFLIGSLIFSIVTLIDGKFTRIEAVIALFALVTYLYLATKNKTEEETIKIDKKHFPYKSLGILVLSGFFVFIGAKYTIEAVLQLSSMLSIGKEIIAASAVALGTSLPELAVSVQAARKKKVDMAIGNVIGSNIFNTFGVLGVPALIKPITIVTAFTFANPAMLSLIFVTIATTLATIFLKDKKLVKREGIILLSCYVVYIVLLFI